MNKKTNVCELLKTECNHKKKHIFIIINWKIAEKITENKMIYQAWCVTRILQHIHQEKKWMKNSILIIIIIIILQLRYMQSKTMTPA